MAASDIMHKKLKQLEVGQSIVERKPHFGLETTSYAWVADYLRDKKIRKQIAGLEEQIKTTAKLPMDRNELKKLFLNGIGSLRKQRLDYLKGHLLRAQNLEEGVLSPETLFLIMRGRTHNLFLDLNLGEEEVNNLFSDLEDGVTQAEKDRLKGELRQTILELNSILENELSPQSRWFYNSHGLPAPYPKGCRWTWFIDTWKEVSVRYKDPVDIDGHKLNTESGHWAYLALEFDKLHKLDPLRDPEG